MKFTGIIVLVFLISCTPGAPEAIIDSIETTIKLKNTIDELEERTAEMEKLNHEIEEQLDNYKPLYSEEELRIGDSLRKALADSID